MSDDRALARSAAIGFTEQLYYAWADLYQLNVPNWDDLSVRDQHGWVERAADVLDRLRPVELTREQPSLFEQVADVARNEAARVLAFGPGPRHP